MIGKNQKYNESGFRRCVLLIALFFIAALSHSSFAEDKPKDVLADSIMRNVSKRAALYSSYIREYEAEAYIKGTSLVGKKNILLRYVPDWLALNTKHSRNIVETLMDIHYYAPNKFTQKVKAVNGTNIELNDLQRQVDQFINVNIYNPTAFNDEVLMPTAGDIFRYYDFSYIGSMDTLEYKIHKLKVEPKQISQKLVSGYLYVVDGLYSIARTEFTGRWNFSTFRVEIGFGLSPQEFLLPTQVSFSMHLKLLGNDVINHCSSVLKYTSIKKYENEEERLRIGYNLTEYFNVKIDSLPIVRDSVFWGDNRPFPLTEEEQAIYFSHNNSAEQDKDSISNIKGDISWVQTKGIFVPKGFDYGSTQLRYSGLLNPFKLGFTGLDGFVYWQQLKLSKTSDSGKELYFNPEVGFVFKRGEVFFKTPLAWLYKPEKFGKIELSLGNRNSSYSSRAMQEIKVEQRDSVFRTLEYYKHYYLSLKNQNEWFTGFLFSLGIDYQLYDPVKSKVNDALTEEMKSNLEDEIKDLIDEQYRSFTPVISAVWTPKQYYRFNNKRKEYLWSAFPTFSIEYARGIPNVFKSNSKYERIEVDVQQRIQLGLLRSVQYYAGAGIFTNTKSIYFADFRKFAKRNFPESWNDRIGGVFQLLEGEWYNASDSYIQMHAMYESPLVLLKFFKKATRDVFKERFYYSQLYTPALPSYSEVGYGVGNFIFNAGAFVSFERSRFTRVGFKFAFEI